MLYRFYTFVHPHVQTFISPVDPETMFERNHLLFWTIVTVTSRPIIAGLFSDEDVAVYTGLHREIRALVSRLLMEPCRSIDDIRALLLLAHYPCGLGRLRRDEMVHTYSSMVKFAAIYRLFNEFSIS